MIKLPFQNNFCKKSKSYARLIINIPRKHSWINLVYAKFGTVNYWHTTTNGRKVQINSRSIFRDITS